MSEREGLPKGFESPYETFLWKELSIIREYERRGDQYRALDYATSLTKYLSPQLRKKLGDGQEIMASVNSAVAKVKSFDFFTTRLVQNREAKRLGRAYLHRFITILSEQLGERLYMEKRGRRVSHGTYEG